MQTALQLPNRWEDYQMVYELECLVKDGENISVRKDVHDRINKIAQDWIGFDRFVETGVESMLDDEDFYHEILREMKRASESEKEHRLLEAAASYIGWLVVQAVYIHGFLEHMRKTKGHGKTLEQVAQTDGHYVGLLHNFHQLENNPVLSFVNHHPQVYEFVANFIFQLFMDYLQDEKNYRRFLNAIERRDDAQKAEQIRKVMMEPLRDELKGVVWTLIAFLNRFDYSNLA
jgi:hypothetical protein